MRSDRRATHHPAYWAFVVQRVSGLLLALYLPFHFWALGQALTGAASLDGFLRWTDQPLVKFGELLLLLLLGAHLTGGVRVLMLEFLAWREWQKMLLAVATVATVAVGVVFVCYVV